MENISQLFFYVEPTSAGVARAAGVGPPGHPALEEHNSKAQNYSFQRYILYLF